MKKLFSCCFGPILLLCIVVGIGLFVKFGDIPPTSLWSNTGSRLNTSQSLKFADFFDTKKVDTEKSEPENQQPADFNGWKFVVIGDTEDGGPTLDAFIREMKQRDDISFIIHVGDVASHGEPEKMELVKTQLETLSIPTYYVPGNNDLVYDEKTERRTLAVYKKVFGETVYFGFEYKNAQLVLLDNSYRRTGFSDTQLEWLKKELDSSTAPYRFLFFHRPLNVPGQELVGDDETPNSREQNKKFLALIAGYTVDHIFNGHVHTSLQYSLLADDAATGAEKKIPVTITGGGGAYPQAILGGEAASFFHYVVVTVPDDAGKTPHTQIVPIE